MSDILQIAKDRNPHEPEFLQAVEEVVHSVRPVIEARPEYRRHKILERMVEPERVIMFRVPWTSDDGEVNINRGYRIQMNGAIGPYKGGMRFHPSVNLSILKFLAFEQTFKNALTTLPMGGGKGGSDFDPKGKSDAEVMRFCQSLMAELFRHIGHNTDVPAGDIGVGAREVGYMYGMYRKLHNEFTGVFTGKGLEFGGSLIRPEATGYGLIYFAAEMLATKGQSLEGQTCLVSGSGNVAQYAVEKLLDLGAKIVAMSDSGGFIHDPAGIDRKKLAWIMDLKNERRGRISDYAVQFKTATYHQTKTATDADPFWKIPCFAAFPCATQNELNGNDAQNLVANGCKLVGEGANMPTTPEGIEVFLQEKIFFSPGKASNAGGVATSGLEMSQNSLRYNWTRQEVDAKLRGIMRSIHQSCLDASAAYGVAGNYVAGANIAGFSKVAEAMIKQGLV